MPINETITGDRGKGKGEITSFMDLDAWQLSRVLCKLIYGWTRNFSSDERFGLVSQLRRAVVSINANIAEGFGRYHPKDKKQFYTTAKSSCLEVEAELIVSFDQGFLTEEQLKQGREICQKIQKTISGLIATLRSRIN